MTVKSMRWLARAALVTSGVVEAVLLSQPGDSTAHPQKTLRTAITGEQRLPAPDRPNIRPPDSHPITEGSFLRDRLRIHGSTNGHSPLSTARSA